MTLLYLFDTAATFRRGVLEKFSLILLIYLDLVLTLCAMSLGLSEQNPYMQILLENPLHLILVKAIVPIFIAWLSPAKLLIPSLGFMIFVIGWDVKELIIFFT